MNNKNLIIKHKVFEDNTGVIEMSNVHKFQLITKNLNIKLHHLKDYIAWGEIEIVSVDTQEWLADYLIKLLAEVRLILLNKVVMG